MGDSETRVAVILALMRQLQEVMGAEAALLRAMRLGPLQELQAEKAALAERYELELRRLRQMPETLGALSPEQRATLEAAMRDFQAALRINAERLRQARQVAEGIAQALSEGLGRGPLAPGYGAPPRPSGEAGARVIPVAFDRRC